jgi:hypothetical protein
MKKIINLSSYIILTFLGLTVLTIMVVGQRDIPRNELKLKYANEASKFMPLMGMQVHYRDEGNPNDSFPIVLIHGTSSSLNTWDSLVKLLPTNKRVIRLDMPAFGLTGPNLENKYTYAFYTKFLNAFLENLKVNKCIGLVYSFDLQYDDDTKIFGYNKNSTGTQLKSILGVGLSCKF